VFIHKCYISDDFSDCDLSSYNATLSCRRIEMFRRNILSLFSWWNYAGSGIVHGYEQVTRRMVTQTHMREGKNGAPSNSVAVPTL
jgi:hypothetical protein